MGRTYKAKYGNCRVTKRYKEVPGLGAWVIRNREQYKRFVKNNDKKKSSMTKARKDALDEIGFFDSIKEMRDDKMFGHLAWSHFYELLKQFKSTEGHCDVPTIFEKNQDLSDWVKLQRIHYDAKLGIESLLSEERIRALSYIDFG